MMLLASPDTNLFPDLSGLVPALKILAVAPAFVYLPYFAGFSQASHARSLACAAPLIFLLTLLWLTRGPNPCPPPLAILWAGAVPTLMLAHVCRQIRPWLAVLPIAATAAALLATLLPGVDSAPAIFRGGVATLLWHLVVMFGLEIVIRPRAPRPHASLCQKCGYNLAGLPPGPCPECGTPR